MQTSNPKLYRQLSEPFESTDTANVALAAFYKDLGEIREKHRICNVVAVVSVNVMAGNEEGEMSASLSYGDPLRVPIMLARELGREQSRFERSIAASLKEK